MFNTTLKQNYVISTAYAVRLSMIFALFGFSPHTLAEISVQNESKNFLAVLHAPRWSASKSHVIRSVTNRTSRDYQSDHFDDLQVIFTEEEFLLDMRPRWLTEADELVHETLEELRTGGADIKREQTFQYDNSANPNSLVSWSLDRISFRYPIARKYDGEIYVYREGKRKGVETFDLRDLERCLDTMRFFGPPRSRFRIETYYQQPVTQRSWIDHYANGYHGAIHTIHCHREYNTTIPSVEVVDNSFATVYLSDGKMISLRYEDREGASVFSEFTLFFH